jgi:hypothetical protein
LTISEKALAELGLTLDEYNTKKRRRYYEKNKEREVKRAVDQRQKHRKKFYELIRRYKLLVGCVRCGYRKYHKALEFHHTDAKTKETVISGMKHATIKRLKTEIRKCIVVCANCHRELHGEMLGHPLNQGISEKEKGE